MLSADSEKPYFDLLASPLVVDMYCISSVRMPAVEYTAFETPATTAPGKLVPDMLLNSRISHLAVIATLPFSSVLPCV